MIEKVVKMQYKQLDYLQHVDSTTIGVLLRNKIKKDEIKRNNYYSFNELMLIVGYNPKYITSTIKGKFYKILADNDFYYETKQRKWIFE